MQSTYFNIDSDDPNFDTIILSCVGRSCEQKKSLDGTKTLVRLCDCTPVPPELDKYTPLTHEEAYTLSQSSEYQQNNQE